MELQGHLLYLDITQICGIGCDFCMYADKHASGKNMVLSELARVNLKRLINDPAVRRISISGEGEPLNNINTLYEILELSQGGNSFEFITSGFHRHEKLEDVYDRINYIVSRNKDTCNIRLSSDSHHVKKIKWKAHGFSIDYWQRKKPTGLSFSFRSVDNQRDFTRNYLIQDLDSWGIDANIQPVSVLEDLLIVGGFSFGIDYKNLVNPAPSTPSGYLDMHGYIAAIELKVKKPFTFGSLNKLPQKNGLDVTVKPNGDVFFYGIEVEKCGNLHTDIFDWPKLEKCVRENPLSYALYTQPLTDLLARLDNAQQIRTIIAKANNPYWLVKEIAKHSDLLEKWKVA
ncbi:radical SAM protein [Shewanella xiamenensis]|uniref:radical SAM protein n=1 Tax=Shewanella TaxID=22 RepID=UPI0021DAA833|nr:MULTISPECIES: radical SAM protein [Shewanella]MCU8040406.1 radical SAM protein [Shewanella sp. SM69]MDH1316112.1 radical SAM protein [Shewanella xiamenensis]